MRCPHCQTTHIIKKGFSKPVRCLNGHCRQRFKCNNCGRQFCTNSSSLNFRLKKNDLALNSKIFFFFVRGLSNCQIALILGLSEHCVRLRLDRMAKQAFSFQHNILEKAGLCEPIAFDGLENFAGSQYDPNNINHAIGAESLFIYDFNFAPLNRKGRTSVWQKKRLAEIEGEKGRYNPSAIRVATRDILKRLCKKTPRLELLSDEHFQYRKVVEIDLKRERILHKQISSKACRNFQNILFAVNHADLMTRQRIAAFARETISFSKTAGAMCQKYMLYAVYKNFMSAQFTKKHVRRPNAHLQSPAQAAGLASKLLKFSDVFHSLSRNADQEQLNEDWKSYWSGQVPRKHTRSSKFIRKKS